MSYDVLAKEAVSLSLSEQIDLMALLANSIQSKNQQDIIPCYDVLHTQGEKYLLEDLKEYALLRGVSL